MTRRVAHAKSLQYHATAPSNLPSRNASVARLGVERICGLRRDERRGALEARLELGVGRVHLESRAVRARRLVVSLERHQARAASIMALTHPGWRARAASASSSAPEASPLAMRAAARFVYGRARRDRERRSGRNTRSRRRTRGGGSARYQPPCAAAPPRAGRKTRARGRFRGGRGARSRARRTTNRGEGERGGGDDAEGCDADANARRGVRARRRGSQSGRFRRRLARRLASPPSDASCHRGPRERRVCADGAISTASRVSTVVSHTRVFFRNARGRVVNFFVHPHISHARRRSPRLASGLRPSRLVATNARATLLVASDECVRAQFSSPRRSRAPRASVAPASSPVPLQASRPPRKKQPRVEFPPGR